MSHNKVGNSTSSSPTAVQQNNQQNPFATAPVPGKKSEPESNPESAKGSKQHASQMREHRKMEGAIRQSQMQKQIPQDTTPSKTDQGYFNDEKALSKEVPKDTPPLRIQRLHKNGIRSVNEDNESAIIGKHHKGKLVDVALGEKGNRANKDWPMTVTIHGLDANPDTVASLSKKAQKAGDSVKTFAYDDMYKSLEGSSKDLSGQLEKWLKDKNNDGRPLRIDAHSMGGRIALAAVDDLNKKGLLKGRKVELNLVASAINGEDSARVAAARLAPTGLPPGGTLLKTIPGVVPGQDMASVSEFQHKLNDIRLPSNVKVRVFTGTQDDKVTVDGDFNKMVRNLHAQHIQLPGADHDSAVGDAARWMAKRR